MSTKIDDESEKKFTGLHSSWGNLKGLQDLADRKAAGEDISEAPKMNPKDEDKEGSFMGEFNVNSSSAPVKMADGGSVMEALKKLIGGDKTDAQKADEIDPVVQSSTATSAGYAAGGEVQNPFQQLINSPAVSLAGYATNPMSAVTDAISNPSIQHLIGSEVPSIQQNASSMTGGAIPPPMPPTTPQQPATDPAFMARLQNGTAITSPQQAPSLSQAAQTAVGAPPTNPGIYQGISADDRANLMKQLLAQKASGGNLAMSGLAGLGDAISNSFGKGDQNAQGTVRQAQAQNVSNQIGITDTARAQKLQDIQANIATQESDPNSPYSQGMRQFLQSQGMKVPSGMSASMLKQTLPDVTKIFDSKMIALTAQGTQGIEAGKALLGQTFADWLKEQFMSGTEEGKDYLESRISGGSTSAPTQQTPSGVKYSVRH